MLVTYEYYYPVNRRVYDEDGRKNSYIIVWILESSRISKVFSWHCILIRVRST